MSHYITGCGSCGSPSIYNPPSGSCQDCLYAPRIVWGCDVGPDPGDTLSFNIKDRADIRFPTYGSYAFELHTYDSAGFNNVTISASGLLTAETRPVYNGRKTYKITYKIRRTDGIESATGTIEVCFKNLCLNCLGDCNQLNGDCIRLLPKHLMQNCNSTSTVSLSDWTGFLEADYLAERFSFNNVPVGINPTLVQVTPGSGPIYFNLSVFVDSSVAPGDYVFKFNTWKNGLSSSVDISVKVNDVCVGVICGVGKICNKCTGECDDLNGNVSVDVNSSGFSGVSGNIIVS